MTVEKINNVADLKTEVLDKPTTKLSQKEINILNSISKDTYKGMKTELEEQTFDLKTTDNADVIGVSLKDLVENFDTQKNISTIEGNEIKIEWGTELGAWIQIYLISHPEISVTMSDQAMGEYLGIDGKIGRFTKQALDELKGRILVESNAKKETEKQIDEFEEEFKDERLNNWITAQLNEALIKSGVNKNVEMTIRGKEISLTSYNTTSKIDIDNGTISIPGNSKGELVNFPKNFEFLLDKDNKINLEESENNNLMLQKMILLSNFLNFTIDKFMKPQKGKSKNPFKYRIGALDGSTIGAIITRGGAKSGLHFNDRLLSQTDILSDNNMRKIGLDKDDDSGHIDFLNSVYNKYAEATDE